MLDRLFGEPEVSGLESDAFWMGLFLGLLTSVGVTTVVAFVLLPLSVAFELLPLVVVAALLLSYPLARWWIRVLSRLVERYRLSQGRPPGPEE